MWIIAEKKAYEQPLTLTLSLLIFILGNSLISVLTRFISLQ